MRAVGKIDADQVAQQVRVRLRQCGPIVGHEKWRDAVFHLLARDGRAVGFVDQQLPRQHVAQQAVGLALRLRVGPAAKVVASRGPAGGPLAQRLQQPALAQAGFGHHQLQGQAGLARCGRFVQPLPGRLQHLQLRLAAHQRRRHAFHTPRPAALGARPRALHQPGGDGFVQPLDHDGVLRLHIKHALYLAVGVLADAQGAGRCGLLHAGRHVDGHAADAAFGIHPTAQQHAARVQPHAHIEARVPVRGQHFGAQRAAFGQQRQAGVHGALGVVFVRAFGAKHGQQVVARVLQHLATLAFHQPRAARQRAVDHGVHLFRVQPLAQRGGAHDVQKEDGHLAQRLCGQGWQRGCAGGGQRGQLRAQRGHGGVHHRRTQHRALRLQGLDGGVEFGGGVGHRASITTPGAAGRVVACATAAPPAAA